MRKALKVIAIILGTLVLVFTITVLFLVKNLPSAWDIKQAVMPPPTKNHEDKIDESKALSWHVLKDDFMNEQKPLSSVCTHLSAAEQSKFLRKEGSASANEFMKALANTEQKDPLAEAGAPLFRFVFRIDGMRGLIDLVEKADAEHDQGIFKKAEFYAKLALAGQKVRANKENVDRLLMKSYNLYTLARAVGKHPQLARDPATLGFCDQIEKNLNMNLEFNAEEQASELQKFLSDAKVDPKEVDYDPNYRSNVQFNFSDKSLHSQHVWLEKLFAKDIAKIHAKINTAF